MTGLNTIRLNAIRLKAIAVVDKDWGIGKDGGLLVHLPGDLKFFKEKTLGNIVIMGRATLESLPGAKPLPGRTTIIMTRNKEVKGDFHVVNSIDSLFELLDKLHAENPEQIPFVAGGESVYQQLMPYTDTCIITKMDRAFDAEKFFVDLDKDSEFEFAGELGGGTDNGVTYKFTQYERIKE